jgi:hypothetical protein
MEIGYKVDNTYNVMKHVVLIHPISERLNFTNPIHFKSVMYDMTLRQERAASYGVRTILP